MTDADAIVVWQANYTPFGQADIVVENVTNNIRFQGQYYDHESGLHYNYFRDYDPELGRYIQSDPIGLAGGINTYGYVGGNPVSFIEPDGTVAIALAFPGTWVAVREAVAYVGSAAAAAWAGSEAINHYNESADDITNDLIDDLVPDPHDYPSDKTAEECDADFDKHPGEEIPTDDPEKRIKRLPDGRTINIHPSRYRPGVPTLDVPKPGSKKRKIKVRYQG
ncbi:MAG: RHS repeat-associated core domain-containing protein [Gammaproteobacteria bacterium]|nr:RHS repeat-associated core domain-containing protein [Gammaproteobacteria bacterium]